MIRVVRLCWSSPRGDEISEDIRGGESGSSDGEFLIAEVGIDTPADDTPREALGVDDEPTSSAPACTSDGDT